jgi:creatinine amidohydrolase/Fe(II)-dependent formamide hydrolase-like protein
VRKKIKTDTKKIMKMLAQNPDNYQMRKKLLDDESIIPKIIQHPQIKVGVMGNPFQARRKIGEEITRQAVKKICEVIRKMEGKR